VWDAWTDPEQVGKWWGPRGFTLTTHSKDLRAGGHWRYTMHGPDGVDYPNIATYFVVEPRAKLVYDHGATDSTPPLFRVTATFTEAGGKTTLDLSFALATPEATTEMARMIKEKGGTGTWDRLAEHLEEATTGKRTFVINRTARRPHRSRDAAQARSRTAHGTRCASRARSPRGRGTRPRSFRPCATTSRASPRRASKPSKTERISIRARRIPPWGGARLRGGRQRGEG
jgi:uncharacterized protein YndB with AHSA1/START domain